MERHNRESGMAPVIDESYGMQCGDGAAQASSYRPPALFVIGKAVDLVQGYSYGKYSDGYSGYYWER
jgi:hypothetical protein